MNKYLLDTSVIIDYLRGRKETVLYINNLEGELTSSFICLAELYEGIYRSQNPKKVEEGVKEFFAGLEKIYSLDMETSSLFGKIRFALKVKGEIIEDLDIILAATCLTHKLTLITNNVSHFQRIKDLEMVTPS